MPRRRATPDGRARVWTRLLGLMLGAVLVASCSASRESADPPVVPAGDGAADSADVRSVVVVGDSITEGADGAIARALPAAGYEPLAIDGVASRRSVVSGADQGGPPSGVEAIHAALSAGHTPDAWVIALGTNDVLQYPGVDQYAVVITQLMSVLPADVPVVWVDVYLRDFVPATDAFNAQLHLLLDQRPDTVVVSWNDVAQVDGVISDDGIHPTDSGYTTFADTIVAGLDALSG